MPDYTVAEGSRIVQGGVETGAGQPITLTEEEAAPLLERGNLQPPGGGKAAPDKQPEGRTPREARESRRAEQGGG